MFILEYLFIMHKLQHILNDILVFFVYLWNVNVKFLLLWYYCVFSFFVLGKYIELWCST